MTGPEAFTVGFHVSAALVVMRPGSDVLDQSLPPTINFKIAQSPGYVVR